MGVTALLPRPSHGDPTTCSKCDPSSLATVSRGPARLGCPHASPKPGREPKQTGKRQHPASDLCPHGQPASPLPWPSIKILKKEEEKFPWRPPGPRLPGPVGSSSGSPRAHRSEIAVSFDMPQGNLICFEIGHPPIQTGIRIRPVNISPKGTSSLPTLQSWHLCIFSKTERPKLKTPGHLRGSFSGFFFKKFFNLLESSQLPDVSAPSSCTPEAPTFFQFRSPNLKRGSLGVSPR